MPTYTGDMFHLLEADTKDIFFKTFSMIEQKFPQLYVRRPSTKAYEYGMRVGALGTFQEKPEGEPVAFDDPVQGQLVRTTHVVYALGFRVSKEMMRDDQHGIINQMPQDLGESARDHMERIAWDLENDGFTGTNHTGLEGEVLYSETHSRLKAGGTASNVLSPAVALSQTGLELIMNIMSTQTSDEGRFINQQASILLHHPNNQHNAYVLLNTEMKPGSANNDRSTVVSSRSGLRPLEVPYLSSTTRWSVHAKNEKGRVWNDREPLEFASAPDALTFDRMFFGSYRASVMFREWRYSYSGRAL